MAIQNVVGSTGISVPVTVGTGSINSTVVGTDGIGTTVIHGTTGIVMGSVIGIRVYINGVDRSDYIGEGSIRVSSTTNSRSTAAFCLINDGSRPHFVPAIDDEVIIYDQTTRVFAGTIESFDDHAYYGRLPDLFEVKCTDYGVLCDRRIANFFFTYAWAANAYTIISGLVYRFLDGTGITFVPPTPVGVGPAYTIGFMPGITAPAITVSEFLNNICKRINYDWRIDYWKNLHIFPKESGYTPAPFALDDTLGNHTELHVVSTRGQYRNRQGVKSSRIGLDIWTDIFPRDFYWFSQVWTPGQTIFIWPTTFPLFAKPIISLNGVEQLVGEMLPGDVLDEPEATFWFRKNTTGIYKAGSWIDPTANTIEVKYPSILPPVVWMQDDAEIALRGKFEAVEDGKGVVSYNDALQLAAGMLARGKVIPINATWKTMRSGLEPGQSITIQSTYPAIDSSILIESVDLDEVGKSFFWASCKGSNSQLQKNASGASMLQRLIEKLNQPPEELKQVIRFTLAETIEGQENPGLSIGVKNCHATVKADGVLRSVTLKWKSVDDGVPTVLPILIDVYVNGFSVFDPLNKLKWAPGQYGLLNHWRFSANPLPLLEGDSITVEVLMADSTAKDGILEITIVS